MMRVLLVEVPLFNQPGVPSSAILGPPHFLTPQAALDCECPTK